MHNHGYEYRAKIVEGDHVAYTAWFNTEAEAKDAMRHVGGDADKLYFCEVRMVRCAEQNCDADPTPRVISTL